jgi:DNA-binding NtrC family response regulator
MEPFPPVGPRPSLKSLLEAYERELIQEALRSNGGNQRRAARALGVLPTTLHEKMKRLGLHRRPPPRLEVPAFAV